MECQIDMGDHGWKHPDIEGILFGSKENAKNDAKRNNLDPEKVFEIDTRPTVGEVAKRIAEDEQHVWDEYFSTNQYNESEKKWPDGRICVFVVTGGSEGLYLHIEVKNENKSHCMILGKTLRADTDKWYECWMSAARIAKMLGA